MNFKHLSTIAICLIPFSALSQTTERGVNIRTDAFLQEGSASLGNSDKVRWDFYKANSDGTRGAENIGGAYDATFEEMIPAGKYVAVAALGNIQREVPFTITQGKVTNIRAVFNAGEVAVSAKRSASDEIIEPLARIEAKQGSEFTESFYGSRTFFAPAGKLTLTGTLGPATASEEITVSPGKLVEHVLVIPSGVVFTTASYADGGLAVSSSAVQFQAVQAEQTLDGVHKKINSIFGVNKPMQLPEGKYLMQASLGQVRAEVPFEVTAGKRTDLNINLNAGVLAIDAPNAERIDIMRRTPDLQQTLESVSARYGQEHQDTLTPGKYLVKVTYPPKNELPPKELEADVTAANRTDLSVEFDAAAAKRTGAN